MLTVHEAALPLQAPPQAWKAWPAVGVAVSVMSVLVGMFVLQVLPPLPHWMPEGLDTAPLPLTLTDRVCVMGSGAALLLSPPPQAAKETKRIAQLVNQAECGWDRREAGIRRRVKRMGSKGKLEGRLPTVRRRFARALPCYSCKDERVAARKSERIYANA
jgi:hypothetical protein